MESLIANNEQPRKDKPNSTGVLVSVLLNTKLESVYTFLFLIFGLNAYYYFITHLNDKHFSYLIFQYFLINIQIFHSICHFYLIFVVTLPSSCCKCLFLRVNIRH